MWFNIVTCLTMSKSLILLFFPFVAVADTGPNVLRKNVCVQHATDVFTQLVMNYSLYIHTHRTELMRRVRRFQVANYACIMIKYAKDDRYSNQEVSTHDK